MLLYLDEDEGKWIREMLEVYLTIRRNESNERLGRDLLRRIDVGLSNYKKGTNDVNTKKN
jgi:hypothetical protein